MISRNGYVQMLLGNGNGTFRQVPTTTPVGGPVAAVADFNNDGNLDLAVASTVPSSIVVLLGNGKGGFAKSVTTTTSIQPAGLAAGHLNKDGLLEVEDSRYCGQWCRRLCCT